MPWLHHSLVSLAAERPDLYQMGNLEPGQPYRGDGAVYVSLSFGRIDQARWALSDPTVRAWVEAGASIIFDDSGEAGLQYPEQWHTLRRSLDELKLKRCRMVWLLQNEHGPRMCRDAFAGHANMTAEAVVIHYWMHRVRLDADGKRPREINRTRRFACFNRKMRDHRKQVIEWIEANGFTDRGLVSHEGRQIGDDARAQSIPWDLHAQVGFCLVNETEMSDGLVLRFTEKLLKPLATGNPFLVAGNPGTLKLLRSYGFKTFAPFIDEYYDEVADPQERLTLVLDAMAGLMSLSDAQFDTMLGWMQPTLDHNAAHFRDGLPIIMDRQHAAVLDAVKLPALV